MLKQIIEKINIVLDEPIRSSGEYLKLAFEAIENESNDTACRFFRECSSNAMKGENVLIIVQNSVF